jgi:hypothetical protein
MKQTDKKVTKKGKITKKYLKHMEITKKFQDYQVKIFIKIVGCAAYRP